MSFITSIVADGVSIIPNRHWLVWIPDDTQWVMTYSEKLAKKALKKGWGCIEFREWKEGGGDGCQTS